MLCGKGEYSVRPVSSHLCFSLVSTTFYVHLSSFRILSGSSSCCILFAPFMLWSAAERLDSRSHMIYVSRLFYDFTYSDWMILDSLLMTHLIDIFEQLWYQKLTCKHSYVHVPILSIISGYQTILQRLCRTSTIAASSLKSDPPTNNNGINKNSTVELGPDFDLGFISHAECDTTVNHDVVR